MDTANQYCYNNYGFHFCHSWAKRTINDSLDDIKKVDDEDHITIHRKYQGSHFQAAILNY